MIPPSTIMVIYGIVTETNIGKLFAAGVIPGLVTALLLMAAVVYMTWRDPEHAPAGEVSTGAQRMAALRGIWGVLVLVLVVLGGIYGGVFTATEGAGIGASGAFFFALARRRLTVKSTLSILVESARTTAMLFTLLIAATIFANFVNFTSMPNDLKDWITHLGLSPVMIVGAMMLIYVVLGHGDGRTDHGAADHPAVLPDHKVPMPISLTSLILGGFSCRLRGTWKSRGCWAGTASRFAPPPKLSPWTTWLFTSLRVLASAADGSNSSAKYAATN